MQNKKRTPLDAQQSHLWIIGGGIAGMAAAAFAIRDAKVPAKNIHILEELDISGGSMDGGHTPHAAQAWVTRGGRMLTDETYLCLWDLFSSIPSLENPAGAGDLLAKAHYLFSYYYSYCDCFDCRISVALA